MFLAIFYQLKYFKQKLLLILVCENKFFSLKIICVNTIYDHARCLLSLKFFLIKLCVIKLGPFLFLQNSYLVIINLLKGFHFYTYNKKQCKL